MIILAYYIHAHICNNNNNKKKSQLNDILHVNMDIEKYGEVCWWI